MKNVQSERARRYTARRCDAVVGESTGRRYVAQGVGDFRCGPGTAARPPGWYLVTSASRYRRPRGPHRRRADGREPGRSSVIEHDLDDAGYGHTKHGDNGYPMSYYCNVFAGGTGGLTFELGKRYQTLSVTIGLADTSTSTAHSVTFTLIGDNVNYLAKPTAVQNGQTTMLTANVSQTSALTLIITDTTDPGTTASPTTVVWRSPTLAAS